MGVNDLTKAFSMELKLVTKGVPNEMRGAENVRLPTQLSSLAECLIELRSLYGAGHESDLRVNRDPSSARRH